MKVGKTLQLLKKLSEKNIDVFTKNDARKIFFGESEKNLEKMLQRLVDDEILIRATRGIYINALFIPKDGYLLEKIALVLRQGYVTYVSFESMLSEYGLISQVPIRYLSVATNGPSGDYKTPFGRIEFTKVNESFVTLIDRSIYIEGRPMRIAKKEAALNDLRAINRNINMLLDDENEED